MPPRTLDIIIRGDAKSALAAFAATQAGARRTQTVAGGALTRLGAVTKAAFVGVGVAAAASTVALAVVGKNFTQAYNQIRTDTGATGKALEGLKADFRSVASSVPASFGSVSTAIATLNTRLGLTGKPLQEVSQNFLTLSRITKTELPANLQRVTRLFNDWGITQQEMVPTMDKLFRASQSTGIGIDRLSQLMVDFGSPLRQLGVDFDFAVAMFSNFERAGVATEKLMPGIRIALKTLGGAMPQVTEQLKAMGINTEDVEQGFIDAFKAIKDAGSTAEAVQIAFKVFGVRAGPDMAAAIREGRFEIEDLMDVISNGTDTIRQAGKDTMTFSERMSLLKNKVLVGLEPIAMRAFDAIDAGAKGALALFDRLSPGVRAFTEALKGNGITSDGYVGVMERMGVALRAVIAWTEVASDAISDWVKNNLQNLSKWWGDHGPMILATAALIGAAMLQLLRFGVAAAQGIVNNWDRVQGPLRIAAMVVGTLLIPKLILLGVHAAASAAQSAILWTMYKIDAVKAAVSFVVSSAKIGASWALMAARATAAAVRIAAAWLISLGPVGLVIAGVALVAAAFATNFGGIRDKVAAVFDYIARNWPQILAIIAGPIGLAVLAVVRHWDKIRSTVMTAVDAVVGVVSTGFGAVASVASAAWAAVSSAVGVAIGVIRAVVSAGLNAVMAVIRAIWGPLLMVFGGPLGTVVTLIIDNFSTIRTVISTVMTAVLNVIRTVWSVISAVTTAVLGFLLAQVRTGFNAALAVTRAVWAVISTVISTVWGVIQDTVVAAVIFVWQYVQSGFNLARDYATSALGTARDILSGIWTSIRTKVTESVDFVKEMVSSGFTAAKDAILNAFRAVRDTMSSIWSSVIEKVRGPVNTVIGIVNALLSGLQTIINVLPGVNIKIPSIPSIGARSGGGQGAGERPTRGGPQLAAGGSVPPFITNGVRAIVGEGNPAHPEYVIPTDPKFRPRALALFSDLGGRLAPNMDVPGFQVGGIIDRIPGVDALKGAADKVKDTLGAMIRGAAVAAWSPVRGVANKALDSVKWEWARSAGKGFVNILDQWVKDQDKKLPEAFAGGGGGSLPRGGGIAGLREPVAGIAARMLQIGQGLIWIVSGWRSSAQQARLYARWLAGVPGQARAAPPGRSKHERGLAVDWGGNVALYQRLARSMGAHFPVRGEHWHMEVPGFRSGGVVGPRGGFAHPGEAVLTHADQLQVVKMIRGGGDAKTIINVEPGAIVIGMPKDATEDQARRLGGSAAKGFMEILAQRRVLADARIK